MSNSKLLEQYLQQVINQFQREQFNKGRLQGQCGYDNQNIGHIAPCPYYHAGYVCGIHERLLEENNVKPQDWNNWELIAHVQNPRYPLSSPATYELVSALPVFN
ncbi:hypothetical protein IQ243_29140 [Nostocales cyanobacterium LEGE 11386]|nr:hypothetical protein [Nostocales cyanobacterium LEGE 11386]